MKLDTPSRKMSAVAWAGAALMLFALPSFAQDEDSDAAPAQQGGHYEARQDDGESETEEVPPQPKPQPVTRRRTVPRVFRARPGGIYAEPNQEAAAPAVEEGQSLGGAGQTQGAADKKIGQGSGSSSGNGGGGGFSGGPLGSSPATQAGGGTSSGRDLCAEQGLANAEEIFDWPQGWAKPYTLTANQSLSFKFTIPPGAGGGSMTLRSVYDGGGRKEVGFSKNKCDFSPSLGACFQSNPRWGSEVRAGASISGGNPNVSQNACILTPGEYYVNIRNIPGQSIPWRERPVGDIGPGNFYLFNNGFPTALPAPGCCRGGGLHGCSSCPRPKFSSGNPGSASRNPGRGSQDPGGGSNSRFPPRVPPSANPQPPSQACWIGTSGSGSWHLSTVPLEVSPPPPPCDACVSAGGHCELGSSCTVAGGNGHFSCQ